MQHAGLAVKHTQPVFQMLLGCVGAAHTTHMGAGRPWRQKASLCCRPNVNHVDTRQAQPTPPRIAAKQSCTRPAQKYRQVASSTSLSCCAVEIVVQVWAVAQHNRGAAIVTPMLCQLDSARHGTACRRG